MKILYVTMQFARGYAQGTERYLSILCDGLRKRGHEALFLAGDPEGRGAAAELGTRVQDEPLVLALPARGWMAIEGTPPDQLVPLLRELSPDIVHVANPAHVGVGVLSAAAELGIPTVATIMDYWWLCPKQTLRHVRRGICDGRVSWRECLACVAGERERSIRKRIERVPLLRSTLLPALYLRNWRSKGIPQSELDRWPRRQEYTLAALDSVDAVIYPSATAAKLVGSRVARPAAHRIPYGLEPRWFAAGKSRGEAHRAVRSPEELLLGFAGALTRHKGAHLVLAALRRLGWTKTRLRIAGGGDDPRYIAELHKLAEPLKVEFVGRVDPDQMPRFIAELDALLVPSLWPENLPIVVLEAYAAGTPVLASRVGGIEEVVTDGAALFAVDSSADLARRLEGWITRRRQPSLPDVSSADQMVEQTLDAYRTLVTSQTT